MTDGFWSLFTKPEPAPRTPGPTVTISGDRVGKWATTALDAETRTVVDAPEGQRNHALNTAAYNLGQLVGGGHLDSGTVIHALTAAAHAAGLDSSEIGPSIGSGLRAGMLVPRTAPADTTEPAGDPTDPFGSFPRRVGTWDAHVAATPPDGTTAHTDTPADGTARTDDPDAPHVDDGTDAVHTHLPRIDWHALWADETVEEWLIEPVLPARRLIALYSPPKVGKSLLLLEWAAGLASGRPILSNAAGPKRRVLYVDFENDPVGDIRSRLIDMGYGPHDLDNLVLLSFPTINTLDTEIGALQLLAAVDVYGCEVVIIDTVSRAITGEENDNDTWLAFYRHTGLRLKQAGVAMIRLDHSGKDTDKGMRGGSAKGGDVDAVWRLRKVTEDVYRLECEMHRMKVPESVLTINRVSDPLRHTVAADGTRTEIESKAAQVRCDLDRLGVPASASINDATAALKAAGCAGGKFPIRDAVRQRKQDAGLAPEDAFGDDG